MIWCLSVGDEVLYHASAFWRCGHDASALKLNEIQIASIWVYKTQLIPLSTTCQIDGASSEIQEEACYHIVPEST